MEVEEIKTLLGCKCKKCFLRNSVYDETISYLEKTYPKKSWLEKLPFLRFRLSSPNLTLEQTERIFEFD